MVLSYILTANLMGNKVNVRGCKQRITLEDLEWKEGAINGTGNDVRSEVRVIRESLGQAAALLCFMWCYIRCIARYSKAICPVLMRSLHTKS